MIIDRGLERRVYYLYTYIDKYINKHSVDAVDVYNEMINVLTYIISNLILEDIKNREYQKSN